MDQAPTGRLPAPRTRSLNSLATATGDAEAKRAAIRSRSPSVRGMAPPPPPGTTARASMITRPTARSVSPSPRTSVASTATARGSVSSRGGAPPPPPVRGSMIRAPSPSSRRASMPQMEDDVVEASAVTGGEEAKPPGHTRSVSTASESLPKSISGGRQPAPSMLTRPKTVADKRPSTTSRLPPPAPARKVPPAAAAKAQELQARLDALKKTAELMRAKSVKPGVSGIKRPGERSAPNSPKAGERSTPSSPKFVSKVSQEERKREEEVSVGESVEEQDKKEKQLTLQRDISMKEEQEAKLEADERARKAQEEIVREQQARKDSMLQRAAAALERKLAEERKIEKEKMDKKQRDEEDEIKRKEEEERRKRERQREEEEELRKKQDQIERDEAERKRIQEERDERQKEEERKESEKRKQLEEEREKEKERQEAERRRQEQESLLQATAEAEREELRKRLEREEEERKRVKEEEDKKRALAEEEARKKREKEDEERRKLEEERRKQREKEELERRQQKEREEEERRKLREKEEEERRKQSEREAETRKKQREEEEERRKQKEKEDEERRKEEAEKKRIQEEETRKRVAKEKEEAENKRKEEEEVKRKKAQEHARQEKERKDLEEKRAREEKFKALTAKHNEEDNNDSSSGSSNNLSTVTKTKMVGGARKARSGFKFDATASTDVVKAQTVFAGQIAIRTEGADFKDEPKESDLRPERKPFMGVGMNGLAGLAAQASAGLSALKPLARSGDRTPKSNSPASRKGPFEISFKTDGNKTAVSILDALDSVAKGQSWVILGFAEEVFWLIATGEGVGQSCLDAMKEHLTPTSISFLYFNSGVGETADGSVKCSEIMWQGEKTKLLVKARAGAIRETLHLFTKRCFTIGVQKEASAHDDLDMSRIFGGSGGEVSSSPVQEERPPVQLLTPRSPSTLTSVPSPVANRVARASSSSSEAKSFGPTGSNPLRPDIQWTGQEEIASAVKEFLVAEGQGAFFVLDIEGAKKNEVKVVASGVGALTDDWREKHCNASKCSVFVIKAENKESGYVSLEKIVYIQWVGRQVKILEKGRAKEIYSGLKEFVREQCGTLAGEMEVLEGQAQDVNLQAVTESITGSRQRGTTTAATLTKKVERATGAPVDLSYTDEAELRSIIAQISQEKQTWVALTYSPNKTATLEILGSGVGENTSISWGKEPTREQEEDQNKRDRQPDTPTAQYKKYCKQSNIVFIVHRFLRIPEQFQFSKDMGTYAKSHFGLMMWQGEDCRVMDKAASSHHWKDFCTLVRDVMEKAGVYVEAGVYVATKMDELNPRDIRKGMRMDMY